MDIQFTYEEACTIYASLRLAQQSIRTLINHPREETDVAILKVELRIIQNLIEKMNAIWE